MVIITKKNPFKLISRIRFCKKFLGGLFFCNAVDENIHEKQENKSKTKFRAKARIYDGAFIVKLLVILLFLTTLILPQNSYADGSTGIGRTRSCDASGKPEGLVNGLFPITNFGNSRDLVFDMSNEVCLSIATTSYVAVKLAINNMNSACGNSSATRYTPSPILDTIDIAKSTKNNTSYPTATCTASILAAVASIGTFAGILQGFYELADQVYENSQICGSNWMKPNITAYDRSSPNYQKSVNDAVQGYIDNNQTVQLSFSNKTFREWFYGGVEVEDNPYGYTINNVPSDVNPDGNVNANSSTDYLNSSNYSVNDGAEFSDYYFGANPCLDPAASETNYPPQKYYMRGSQTANFNCKRYQVFAGQKDPIIKNTDGTFKDLSEERLKDFRTAYNCCKFRSENFICIDYGGKETFCRSGGACNILNDNNVLVSFKVEQTQNNLLCASTHSLCPYNFSIGGGSEICNYYRDGIWNNNAEKWNMITEEDVESGNCAGKSEIRNADCTFNEKAGKCSNYCQQLNNCTAVFKNNYEYESEITSPYFSNACLDFIGDSRNQTSFNSGFLFGSQRHFSAPIAQCVKETMENVFYNRFGHSKCASSNEYPNLNGICSSNSYQIYDETNQTEYKKGDYVSSKSFFARMQENLESAVKMTLSLAVMFYGMATLLGSGELKKSDLIMFATKVALVLYFCTSNAWQTQFFDGVYGASGDLSQIVFKISANSEATKRDGCQFGNVTTDEDGNIINSASSDYPDGKSYLALWDTLDCKIARYLGFGAEDSVANIVTLIALGIFSGPIGIYFAFSLMFFGIFLFASVMRALHIFLCGTTAVIMMVYISVFIIPTVMLKRTTNLFKSWLTHLIGFCLQPMILFAYIAIFITIMDKTLIGSAKFYGNGPNKTISCNEYCADSNGNVISSTIDPDCDDKGNEIINPMEDSFACIIDVRNISKFGKTSFKGFELFGIEIPLLKMEAIDIKKLILTLVKSALIMYILCQFIDQIPAIMSYLIGGASLSGGPAVLGRALNWVKTGAGLSDAARERAIRGTFSKKGIVRSKIDDIKQHIRGDE
jgi:type IV secretory pathway VirB6-like protein